MGWQCVRLDEVALQPWKNGGGTTRELLAWPSAADWRVRISVAQVAANGPFSCFEGVQRWFAVLDGAGVQLTIDGITNMLTADSHPIAFEGSADTSCTLIDGVTQDFNLMTRQAPAVLQRVKQPCARTVQSGCLVALYAMDQSALFQVNGDSVEIEPGTLAWQRVQPGGTITVQAHDALWMEITL